jgi:Flp pilus assembly protein TadD
MCGLATLAASIEIGRGASTGSAIQHRPTLLLVLRRRIGEALDQLATATLLNPDIERDGVAHALALDAAGMREQADAALTEVVERHPFDRDALSLLVRFRLDRHDMTGALTYARRLSAIQPGNAELQRLVQQLARTSHN